MKGLVECRGLGCLIGRYEKSSQHASQRGGEQYQKESKIVPALGEDGSGQRDRMEMRIYWDNYLSGYSYSWLLDLLGGYNYKVLNLEYLGPGPKYPKEAASGPKGDMLQKNALPGIWQAPACMDGTA